VILDAAIIGAGPAGTAAALSLKRLCPYASVVIFDSSAGGKWHPGETLPPRSAEILKSLDSWNEFLNQDFIENVATRAVWGSAEPYDNEFLFSLHGSGWRIDRARFDSMLRERARLAGVVIENVSLSDSSQTGGVWTLCCRGAEYKARFVIDASGRAASFAVQRGSTRLTTDRLAGAFVLFQFVEGSAPQDGCTLIEAQEEGWWYSSIVPGSIAVVSFMTDTDLIRSSRLHDQRCWEARLAASTLTRRRLAHGKPQWPASIHAARSQRLSRMGGQGWVAAGDAAMAFDPLSSQGILKALRSGKLASFVAADYLQRRVESHERYEMIQIAEYRAYETAKAEYYGMEQRWPGSEFWKRRQAIGSG
jgi:flavin-dependent dehydrogenase